MKIPYYQNKYIKKIKEKDFDNMKVKLFKRKDKPRLIKIKDRG